MDATTDDIHIANIVSKEDVKIAVCVYITLHYIPSDYTVFHEKSFLKL